MRRKVKKKLLPMKSFVRDMVDSRQKKVDERLEALDKLKTQEIRKAVEGSEISILKKVPEEWREHMYTWLLLDRQVLRILRKNMRANGTLKRPFDAAELTSIAATFKNSVLCQRLLIGESTENINSKNVNLNMEIVKQIEEYEKENGKW